jgi:hypothetical protein
MQGARLAAGPLAQRDIERIADILLRGLARQAADAAQHHAAGATLATASTPLAATDRRRDGENERAA